MQSQGMPMATIVKRTVIVLLALVIGALLVLYLRAAGDRRADLNYHAALTKSLRVSSSGFEPNGEIPARFTCLGAGQSPELTWDNAPGNARSYAVLVVDFDAPSPGLALFAVTHWMVYDLAPDQHSLGGEAKTPNAYMPACPP